MQTSIYLKRAMGAGVLFLLFGCLPPPKPAGEVTKVGETFNQILESYAKLYDGQMVSIAGNDQGVRVFANKGLIFPLGAYRPVNAIDDLAPECYAARDQIRQFDLVEYPQVSAANELQTNFALPTTLTQGLGILKVDAGSTRSYKVKFEAPVALFLPQSEVDKLWAKKSCSSKVQKKGLSVAVVRGYIYARLVAVVQAESKVAPTVKVLDQDTFTIRYMDNGSWEISDRAAKPYMWLASTKTFSQDAGVIARGETEVPAPLSRPSDEDAELLQRGAGRYGGDK